MRVYIRKAWIDEWRKSTPMKPCQCPIARALGPDWYVSPHSAWSQLIEGSHQLTERAKEFVRAVDGRGKAAKPGWLKVWED